MIFKALKIRNFKSHKDTEIQFNDGITIITGENGAGKTSIFEAIQYALFKKTNNAQKDLVKHDSNEMTVELTFIEKGNTYKVNRAIKGNTTTSKLYKKDAKNDDFNLYVEGNKETDNSISQIISMDNDLFLNAIYIKQGEITDLISKKSSERKKLITRLLKIDDLEKCWSQMPKIIKTFEHKEAEMRGMVGRIEEIQSEIKSNKSEIKSLEKEHQKLLNEKKNLENEKGNVITQRRQMEKSRNEYSILMTRYDNEKSRLGKNQKEKKTLVKKHKTLTSDEEKLIQMEKGLENINIPQMREKISSIKSKIMYLQQQNNEYQESLENLKDVNGRCPTCQSFITAEHKSKLIDEYKMGIEKNNVESMLEEQEMRLLNEKLDVAEEQQGRIRVLKSKVTGKADIEERLTQVEEEIMGETKTIKDIMEQLKNNPFDTKAYLKLSHEEKSLDMKLNRNIERTGIINGKIDTMKRNIQKMSDEEKMLHEMKMEMKELRGYISLLEDCRGLYSKDGIQSSIRAMVKPTIQENTRKQFNKFNFDYSDLLLDDDYNVSVISEDEELGMALLSGGEQISIALALRLGITETIAKGNVDCILLDEPTNHLDRVRIQELSSIISSIDNVPQVFIVTHDKEFEKIADTLLNVVKSDGASEVMA